MAPHITVVMATWNRGRHILPSVRSVLSQTMTDFELLVIGDAVTDDTEIHLSSINDSRLRWINLPERWGSQSGPNNRGLEEARAPIVAYCGHDDVWSPDHLARLLDRYRDRALGAVCSGLVVHVPNPRFPYRVRGLFEGMTSFTPRIFTPPSAFSHRVGRELPHWRRRRETEFTVDYAFQAELGGRGCKFGSTGRITVHKWSANGRYLSYFVPTSIEQEAMVAKLKTESFEAEIDRMIEIAQATDSFMNQRSAKSRPGGERAAISDQRRGIDLPPTISLRTGVLISQDVGPRGMDWRPMQEEDNGYRWCGPNVNPRYLLNVIHNGRVEIEIDVIAMRRRGFPDFSVYLNSEPAAHKLERTGQTKGYVFGRLRLIGPLLPDRASVIEFSLPGDLFLAEGPPRKLGFAIGNVRVMPESWLKRLSILAHFESISSPSRKVS